VRELTSAEYRTALAVLGNPRASDRERIRLSGLPSSTYNVARRRVFEEGWLVDLAIPNPGPCGFAGVEFLLVRPTLSQRQSMGRTWGRDPDCVLLWSGVHAVFGVFFRRSPDRPPDASESPRESPDLFRLRVGPTAGSIPVYFDYSGLWARFGRQPQPPDYPAGLDRPWKVVDGRALSDAKRLLLSEEAAASDGGRWTNPVDLSRSSRWALANDAVQVRTILRHARVPPFEGRRIAEVIFVRGRLRASETGGRLLNALTKDCRAYPFLFTEADGQVLFAGLGQTSASGSGRVPIASADRSIMSAINESLDPADVLVEPVEAIEEPVSHRYSHALPGPALSRDHAT